MLLTHSVIIQSITPLIVAYNRTSSGCMSALYSSRSVPWGRGIWEFCEGSEAGSVLSESVGCDMVLVELGDEWRNGLSGVVECERASRDGCVPVGDPIGPLY